MSDGKLEGISILNIEMEDNMQNRNLKEVRCSEQPLDMCRSKQWH
jgi:hypothetical protein